MKKIYLVYRKKRVDEIHLYSDVTFEGIVTIVTACETKELAQEYLESDYEKEKSDFYSYKEAFVKGKVFFYDDTFKILQVTDDRHSVTTWEIKEINLQK